MYHQNLPREFFFCESCYFEIWLNKEGKKIIEEILNSSKRKCFVCESEKNITRHHIIPIHCGGLDLEENIVHLCDFHHKQLHRFGKDQKDDLSWLKIIKKMKDRNIYKLCSNSNNKKEDTK